MTQPALLVPRRPPQSPLVDLTVGDCRDDEWLEGCEGAQLAIVDPPWSYDGPHPTADPGLTYACMATEEIATLVARLSFAVPTIAVWCTWPLLEEWMVAFRAACALPYRSGGAWAKSDGRSGHYGPGYWWAGCSEPILVYARPGGDPDRSARLRNAWYEPPEEHSRKPVAWQADMISRWTDPGATIVDPFAGLGSVAEAVLLAGQGRRYRGREVSAERAEQALALVAQGRGR